MKTTKKRKRLTLKERRLAILKDALAQVKVGGFKAKSGTFLDIPSKLKYLGFFYKQAQPELMKKDIKCVGCFRGALLISTIRKENKVTIFDLDNAPSSIENEMVPWSRSQRSLMECYFEGFGGYSSLYERLPNNKQRLMYILRNAIRNGGMFKPAKHDSFQK